MGRVQIGILVVLAVLVAACGGAGESEDTTTTTSTTQEGESETTTTTAAPTTTQAVVAGNASDDFCQFITDYANEVAAEFNVATLSPEQIEAAFRDNLDAINQAADLAPSEIRPEVEMFAVAYGGFVDFLEEYDFNFMTLPEDALEDPRLQAMEDPALEEAGERIEEYCGIEDFIATPPSAPADPAGVTAIPGGELPEEFPSELEPPGGVVVATVTVSGATSVTFDTATPADDVIDYYTDVLGAPVQELADPKGALWTMTYDGVFVNLVVAETSESMSQVNVSLGGP